MNFESWIIKRLDSLQLRYDRTPDQRPHLGGQMKAFRDILNMIRMQAHPIDKAAVIAGRSLMKPEVMAEFLKDLREIHSP